MFRRALLRLERSLAYFPELTLKGTPEHVGLRYEELWLKTEDGNRVHAWWIPGPNGPNGGLGSGEPAARPTWVYLHGSGGNISARLDGYRAIHQRTGANILAVDYRGFGLSPGRPSESATYTDARAAVVEAVRRNRSQQCEPGPLVFLGVSMGAAIATKIAEDMRPDALLLESPPSSFPDLAPVQYPWTKILPLSWLMQIRYETRSHIARLANVPLLVMHGDQDDIVPLKYVQMVYDSANDPKRLFVIKGGTHDRPDLVDPKMYYSVVNGFIDEFASGSLRTSSCDYAAD
ncbi:MAG: alpha/beta hydrolase [Chloroflexi bacterium]|nr:alpha/beta hydrolase [Chloroflexota bacterium]